MVAIARKLPESMIYEAKPYPRDRWRYMSSRGWLAPATSTRGPGHRPYLTGAQWTRIRGSTVHLYGRKHNENMEQHPHN